MDLDKLGDLARQAYRLPNMSAPWETITPESREAWRAAADAVRMAVQPALPDLLPLPPQLEHQLTQCLRERIVGMVIGSTPWDMKPTETVERARLIESYILGSDDA